MSAIQKLFFVALAVVVVECVLGGNSPGGGNVMEGGAGDEQPANNAVRKMVKQLEPLIKANYPGEVAKIEPISFKTQVVAGTNYLIRARIQSPTGEKKIVHLRLWETLFDGVKFGAIKTKVNERTPLTAFMKSDV